jgi:hypothetical protein
VEFQSIPRETRIVSEKSTIWPLIHRDGRHYVGTDMLCMGVAFAETTRRLFVVFMVKLSALVPAVFFGTWCIANAINSQIENGRW